MRMSILLIEESGAVSEAVTKAVERSGFKVLPLRDAREAIDRLSGQSSKSTLVTVGSPRQAGFDSPTLLNLCGELFPACSERIEGARSQVREAITALARRFNRVITELEEATAFRSGLDDEPDVVGVISRSQQELGSLISQLGEIASGRETIAAEVAGMNKQLGELKEMAYEIANIAMQTSLLAMNAAIEVTHAGEFGKGYSVVIEQVRKLSDYSAETSKRMAQNAGAISEAVKRAVAASSELTGKDMDAIGRTERTVNQVIDDFSGITRQLTASASVLQSTNVRIREDVGEVLVSLQFEDRISQILARVSADLAELHGVIERTRSLSDQGAPLQAEVWLKRMEASYTMREQQHSHDGAVISAPSTSEITFF